MSTEAKFPTECLEDIFRHLSGEELLQCTLVCPEWNEIIGSTRSVMQKIVLNCFDREYFLKPMKEILTNSTRKYECLELAGEFSDFMEEFLSSRGRKWKQVCTNHLRFCSYSRLLDFLGIFQSSVQKLVLHETEFIIDNDSTKVLHFP